MRFLIIALLLFFACADQPAPPPSKGQIIYETPETPDPIIPVKFTLLNSSMLKLHDGTDYTVWNEGAVKYAGGRDYTFDNKIYTLDDYGQTAAEKFLVCVPDFIRVDGSDIWTVKTITPSEAVAAGYLSKYYTRVYKNADEYGSAWTRQYQTESISLVSGQIYLTSTVGAIYHINGSETAVRVADEFGIVINYYNSTTRTAKINGVGVNWSTNYMNSALEWLELDRIWYSGNGYIFNGSTLDENSGIMTDWRMSPFISGYSESPVLIGAGASGESLYWIECNSGWLIEHVPSINQIFLKARLWAGDGLRTSGLAVKQGIKPVIISNVIYYNNDGQVYGYNLTSGINSFIISGGHEVRNF